MRINKLFIVFASLLIFTGWGNSDLQQGKEYFRAKQADKAIDSFTKAIQSNPKEQEAYFFRAATHSAIGQFNQAIEDYTKTIELNPQYSDAYWSRGYCYANIGKGNEAIADFTTSLKLGTKFEALVYKERSKAYVRKGMFDEAEADAKSILRLKPGEQETTQALEEMKKWRSDPNFSSLKIMNIAEQPQYGEAPLNEEVQKANDQFVSEVIKDYKTKELAIEGMLKYAWDLYKKGNYTTSMRRFNEVWLLDKNNPEVFHGYSLILRAWGYVNEADKWEQKAKDGGYQDLQK